MALERPDLSRIDPAVRTYIEALEARLDELEARHNRGTISQAGITKETETALLESSEPPTTLNVITATATGIAKRTPRHLYSQQRRGGMGVFDLETPQDETPELLALADQDQDLLLITNLARAFRLPVSAIAEKEVRSRGESITGRFSFSPGEKLAALLPDQAEGYVALLSQTGHVRLLRHHVFGEYMKPGTTLYDVKTMGMLASACRTPGDGDLFIATRQGKAIRFSEKIIPPQGGLGIRLADGDQAVAITAVYASDGVFLLGADGRGTIRLMEGFSANKSTGGSGKIALNSDHLVAAAEVESTDDIFIISELSKIIRFQAEEVPPKEGVVQGVICMSLRSDQTCALAISKRLAAL
jgi:DNA gyrase subunit A